MSLSMGDAPLAPRWQKQKKREDGSHIKIPGCLRVHVTRPASLSSPLPWLSCCVRVCMEQAAHKKASTRKRSAHRQKLVGGKVTRPWVSGSVFFRQGRGSTLKWKDHLPFSFCLCVSSVLRGRSWVSVSTPLPVPPSLFLEHALLIVSVSVS